MFIEDGIVYGDGTVPMLKIDKVKALPDRIMLLTFNTGETRVFDAAVLTGPVFKPLEDDDVFQKPFLDHGIVTWDHGAIDCSPEYMYEHSYEYSMVI